MEELTLPQTLSVVVLSPCQGVQEVTKVPSMDQYVGTVGPFDRVTLRAVGSTWEVQIRDSDTESACYGRRNYRLDTPSTDPRGTYSFWTGSALDPNQGTLAIYDV